MPKNKGDGPLGHKWNIV